MPSSMFLDTSFKVLVTPTSVDGFGVSVGHHRWSHYEQNFHITLVFSFVLSHVQLSSHRAYREIAASFMDTRTVFQFY